MRATPTTMSVQTVNRPNFVMNFNASDRLSLLLSPVVNLRLISLGKLSSLIDPILSGLMIIGLLTGLALI